MSRILLIEDEEGLVITLSDRLQSEGFKVVAARDGKEGEAVAMGQEFDLIILDLMLPRKKGLDVCRDLRINGNDTPILILTAKGETIDKVLGLRLGADDYLTKPFENAELLARVDALLRRAQQKSKPVRRETFSFNNVDVNFIGAEVLKNGSMVELSPIEFKLLRFLVENQGAVLSRNELLDAVWGYDAMPTTRTVDVHILWLRQKLEDNPKQPKFIQTVHGLGYKFVC